MRAKEEMDTDSMMMDFRSDDFQNEITGYGDMGTDTVVLITMD